ncbi:MAG TPA: phospholipase D-like domain-containing protein [Gemmataceae bacterium]|nr:phospholipase D-like domain-containing protein [Gemmataceae bacterium]
MTIRLLYHHPDSPGAVSPFDEAIISIATGQHVRLACPYISPQYLRRALSVSASWRLLTDVEEWLSSSYQQQRKEVHRFLVRNHSTIRHLPRLHAKVAIASRAAMLGSANFTDFGIRWRTEVSVLLEDEPQVEELVSWFEAHWVKAYELPIDEIAEFIKSLPKRRPADEDFDAALFPLLSSKPARLVALNSDASVAHRQLVQRVGMAGSREWVEGYLDLVRLLLDELAMKSSDPRLAMSIWKKSGGRFLPVSINNRYVLAPENKNGERLIGIIFGHDPKRLIGMKDKVAWSDQFDPLRGEDSKQVPFFVRLRSAEDIIQDDEVRSGWLEAARCEIERARSSPYRRFHVPACYNLVADPAYRRRVLDEGFPVFSGCSQETTARGAAQGRPRPSSRHGR